MAGNVKKIIVVRRWKIPRIFKGCSLFRSRILKRKLLKTFNFLGGQLLRPGILKIYNFNELQFLDVEL